MKHECENCKLSFDAEDPMNCPRCSSRKIKRSFEKKKFGEGDSSASSSPKEKVVFSHQSFSMRDGKDGWKAFHSSEVRSCPQCAGTDFEYNWKHKEKTCKKCGSIYPIQRRA